MFSFFSMSASWFDLDWLDWQHQ
jgi:hypothetical protein